MRPLDGVTVLELVQKGPGAFVAMMLADMGAKVIKIETPARTAESGSGGSPKGPSAAAQAVNMVNRGKHSIVLDLKMDEGQAILHRLATSATVVIEGFRPEVTKRLNADYPALRKLNPGLVYCSLSGYGQDGPYRDLPGHDLNFVGMAGILNLLGPRNGSPVVPPNLIADYGGAAMHAFAGISLALMVREKTGKGQHVDISYLDTAFALMTPIAPMREFASRRHEMKRGDGVLGGYFPFYGIFETKDGRQITIGCVEPWLWKNLCQALEREDLIEAGMPAGPNGPTETERQAWCRSELAGIFKTRSRDDWFDFLRHRNVCVGKVNSLADVFEDEHLRHRKMVVPMAHPEAGEVLHVGVPIKLSETPGFISGFAPWKGQHSEEILTSLGYSLPEIEQLRSKQVV